VGRCSGEGSNLWAHPQSVINGFYLYATSYHSEAAKSDLEDGAFQSWFAEDDFQSRPKAVSKGNSTCMQSLEHTGINIWLVLKSLHQFYQNIYLCGG
jgi:hypothetical protein